MQEYRGSTFGTQSLRGHLALNSSPLKPCVNKLSSQYIIQDHMASHYYNMATIKSAIDNKPPKSTTLSIKKRDQVRRDAVIDKLKSGTFTKQASVNKNKKSYASLSSIYGNSTKPTSSRPLTASTSWSPSNYNVRTQDFTRRPATATSYSIQNRTAGICSPRHPENAPHKNVLDITYSGDYLDKHHDRFQNSENIPFTPRIKKRNAKSYLSQSKHYAPPTRSTRKKSDDKNEYKHITEEDLQKMDEADRSSDHRRWIEEQSKFVQKLTLIEQEHEDAARSSRSRPSTSRSDTQRLIRREETDLKYLQFVNDVTNDILTNEVYSDRALHQLMERHVNRRKHDLTVSKMWSMLDKLKQDLDVGKPEIVETRHEREIKPYKSEIHASSLPNFSEYKEYKSIYDPSDNVPSDEGPSPHVRISFDEPTLVKPRKSGTFAETKRNLEERDERHLPEDKTNRDASVAKIRHESDLSAQDISVKKDLQENVVPSSERKYSARLSSISFGAPSLKQAEGGKSDDGCKSFPGASLHRSKATMKVESHEKVEMRKEVPSRRSATPISHQSSSDAFESASFKKSKLRHGLQKRHDSALSHPKSVNVIQSHSSKSQAKVKDSTNKKTSESSKINSVESPSTKKKKILKRKSQKKTDSGRSGRNVISTHEDEPIKEESVLAEDKQEKQFVSAATDKFTRLDVEMPIANTERTVTVVDGIPSQDGSKRIEFNQMEVVAADYESVSHAPSVEETRRKSVEKEHEEKSSNHSLALEANVVAKPRQGRPMAKPRTIASKSSSDFDIEEQGEKEEELTATEDQLTVPLTEVDEYQTISTIGTKAESVASEIQSSGDMIDKNPTDVLDNKLVQEQTESTVDESASKTYLDSISEAGLASLETEKKIEISNESPEDDSDYESVAALSMVMKPPDDHTSKDSENEVEEKPEANAFNKAPIQSSTRLTAKRMSSADTLSISSDKNLEYNLDAEHGNPAGEIKKTASNADKKMKKKLTFDLEKTFNKDKLNSGSESKLLREAIDDKSDKSPVELEKTSSLSNVNTPTLSELEMDQNDVAETSSQVIETLKPPASPATAEAEKAAYSDDFHSAEEEDDDDLF